jgi:uncharacterized membrane protein
MSLLANEHSGAVSWRQPSGGDLGFCSDCGVHVVDAGGVCPICRASLTGEGESGRAQKVVATAVTCGERAAAAAAYLCPVVPLLLLLLPGWRRSPLVRFHALQSLLFYAALLVAGSVLGVIVLAWFSGMIVLVIWPLYAFAALALLFLLVVKAAKAELFELPLLGRVALRDPSLRN